MAAQAVRGNDDPTYQPTWHQRADADRRKLLLSMLRVEVRLYRRSRTSANTVQHPPHFEYLLRCTWSETPSSASNGEPSALEKGLDSDGEGSGSLWWDKVPKTYTVRRKWGEIVKFHEALVTELAVDPASGTRRSKTNPPRLPQKGDLDSFILGVAATGDANCLNGKNRADGLDRHEDDMTASEVAKLRSGEDLDDLRVIYVENRLMPYLRDVSKILAELPTDVIVNCAALKSFITGRATGQTAKGPFGPSPLLLDNEDLDKASRLLRMKFPDLSVLARPTTVPEPRLKVPGSAKGAKKADAAPPPPSMPASPQQNPSEPSPRSPPARSGSVGSLGALGDDAGSASGRLSGRPNTTDCRLDARDPQERERRLATSHYGFFARSLPSTSFTEFGHASQRDFWKRMAIKEQKELGRRTLLKFKKGGLPASAVGTRHGGRLTALPPLCGSADRPATGAHELVPLQEESHCGHRVMTQSILELSGNVGHAGPSLDKRAEIKEDIREGFHVTLLSEAASEEPHTKRMAALIADGGGNQFIKMPSIDESLKVYKKYQELHEMDGDLENDDVSEFNVGDGDGDGGDDPDELQQSRVASALESGFARELLPISWPVFFNWVQREYDFASHFRYKAVCSALMRALKRWKEWEATPPQRFYGVSLNMMLQWTFPGLLYSDLAQILTWIATYELERIRLPTPRLIEAQDRRQLEGIFHAMALGQDFCTAEDIAGGTRQDTQQRLKNIVDAETVKNVCGDGKMTQNDFLELFCKDNCRAHEDSRTSMMDDGSKMVLVDHDIVGFSGWVYDIPPRDEEIQRQLIVAIEAEVVRWNKMARSRKTRLHDVNGQQGGIFS